MQQPVPVSRQRQEDDQRWVFVVDRLADTTAALVCSARVDFSSAATTLR